MGIATTAGQNVAANAKALNFRDLMGDSINSAISALTGPQAPAITTLPAAIGGATSDFVHGIFNPAPAAPPGAVSVALPTARPVASTPATAAAALNPGVVGPATPADVAIAYSNGQDRAARTANPVMSAIQDYTHGGGNLSLNMIGALAHAQAESSSLNKTPKVQTDSDKAVAASTAAIKNYWDSKLADAQKRGDSNLIQQVLEGYKNDAITNARGASQVNSTVGQAMVQ